MSKKLTTMRKLFVKEIIIDWNATKAAERAGFSKKTARSIGSELLTFPNIQEAIAKEIEKRSERTEITADMVLKQIARLGNYDIRKIYTDDGSLKPVQELDDETAAAIQGIDFNKKDKTVKVKLSDKRAALELLGRHLGIFEKDNKQRGTVIIYNTQDVNIPDNAGISEK